MKRFYKYSLYFVLISALLLCASGCSMSPKTPQSILEEIQRAEGTFPVGRTYPLNAAPENALFMTDALFSSLFGNGKLPPERALLEDGVFYFGLSSPCEYIVLRCENRDDCEAVSQMCLKRLDSLKSFWKDSEEFAYVQNGSVTVRGRWVFLCVSPTSENAVRAFRRAV